LCLYGVHHCSDELKELEAKLRAGYVNRERAAQLAEKQASQMLDAVNYYAYFITLFKIILSHS